MGARNISQSISWFSLGRGSPLDYRRRTDQQIESMKKENLFYHRMILVNGYRSKDLWADAVSNRVMRKILS